MRRPIRQVEVIAAVRVDGGQKVWYGVYPQRDGEVYEEQSVILACTGPVVSTGSRMTNVQVND